MTKKLIFAALAVGALMAACHRGPGHSPREPEARARANGAAASLVAVDHTDTLALQRAILDAKATQSEYALMGDTVAVRVFDEAFREHLKQHDAGLYAAIFTSTP